MRSVILRQWREHRIGRYDRTQALTTVRERSSGSAGDGTIKT